MRKVAIFTEGQGELIFVRHLLPQVIGYEHLSFECWALRSDSLFQVPHKHCSPKAIVHFLIVNVGSDERVVSAIQERHTRLVKQGFDEIIGLRDMYSRAYRKRARCVDSSIIESFIQAQQAVIRRMSHSEKIRVFFAIMELEAWLLSMYDLFRKMDPRLTCAYIEDQLGFDLKTTDPETEFFHPANEFADILGLIGEKYNKSRDQMESILSHMVGADVDVAVKSGHCNSFKLFLSAVRERNAATQANGA
jgi:hypothetical protein